MSEVAQILIVLTLLAAAALLSPADLLAEVAVLGPVRLAHLVVDRDNRCRTLR